MDTTNNSKKRLNSARLKSLSSGSIVAAGHTMAARSCQRPDSGKIIATLDRLIVDPVITPEGRTRINRLLGRFLTAVDQRYRVEHLAVVSRVLEYLATTTCGDETTDRESKMHLDRMLKLCERPPSLGKMSDRERCTDGTIERYLAVLGRLTTILSTDEDVSRVLDALHASLIDESEEPSILELGLCREAIEKSGLAAIAATLAADVSSSEVYRRVLELALVLANISHECCCVMLTAGILDNLFERMTSEVTSDVEQRSAIAITNLLWFLMRSILIPSANIPTAFVHVPTPSMNAMRSLRKAFRHRVVHSWGNVENQILRNDLASLMLAGLAAYPSWSFVGSGLAEDLVVSSLVDESGVEGTWTEGLAFSPTDENLLFRKIMLTTLCHLSKLDETIAIMTERKVMPVILAMINPMIDRGDRRWSRAQVSHLSRFALRTLGRLGPRMPEEFTRHEGSTRLSSLVEWSLSVEFDADLAMDFTKTICSLATASKYSQIVRDLGEGGMAQALLKLVDRILTFGSLDTRHQRIATLAIIALASVVKADGNFPEICDPENLDVITRLLERCLDQRADDFPLDQRLLVAIGSFVWDVVVRCPALNDKFVNDGGIYAILDTIDVSRLHVRCLYLGVLTDLLSSSQHGAVQFCTWRGAGSGNKNALSLLMETWRQEETRLGVKRTADGCIDDVEVPIMPTGHWNNASRAKADRDSSPILASIFVTASVRPKIYALRKIMKNEAERYRELQERYGLFPDRLSVEDQLTVHIADHYYRFVQGQTWSEVSRYLEQIGVNMLGMDGEIAVLMNQRHREWAMYVRRLQDEILRSEKRKESELEREEFARVRDSRITPATLRTIRDIDYLRRTTEHDYMLKRKKSQCARVNDSLRFPESTDDRRRYRHRTFNERWNFTTILQQNHTMPSVCAKPLGATIINQRPLTPANANRPVDGTIKIQRRKDFHR